jgi:N-carbamoyl-L-amino-acid hydrolase
MKRAVASSAPLLVLAFCISLALAQAPAQVRLNSARIMGHLQALSQFGKNPQGGVSRLAYSDADRRGREYAMQLMRDAGLDVKLDDAANIIGFRQGSDPSLKPLVIGSHIDSVPEGGNYDGDVGSMSAIEVAQTLREKNIVLRHPLQVVIFENEEGGTIGSHAMALGLDQKQLESISFSGKSVRDGIRFLGGNPEQLSHPERQPGSIAGYLELHIEQGGILDQEKINIGVVEGIVGILHSDVTVTGFANHAGTTPMDQRHDALLAAARLIEKVNEVVTRTPGRQVGTVGWVKVQPGAYNVIPGTVTSGLELRDLDKNKILEMFQQIKSESLRIAGLNVTRFSFTEPIMIDPALTDPDLQRLIDASAKDLGLTTKKMPSGAGHDAQEMARIGPAGMIFIPSVGGISHAPKEFSHPEDIERGANVLLESVLRFDARQ